MCGSPVLGQNLFIVRSELPQSGSKPGTAVQWTVVFFFFLMGFGTGVSPSVSAGPKESIMGAPQSLSAAPLSGHTPWTKFLPLLLLAWLLLFTWMPIWKATV